MAGIRRCLVSLHGLDNCFGLAFPTTLPPESYSGLKTLLSNTKMYVEVGSAFSRTPNYEPRKFSIFRNADPKH